MVIINETNEEGYNFTPTMANWLSKIKDMPVYDSDIWVTSFPKSGTTWTQEMVWLIANDLDYENAKKSLEERFPFLEFSGIFDLKTLTEQSDVEVPNYWYNTIKLIEEQTHPRFIKTHMPWNVLPKEIQNGSKRPKIIHITRNPKDVCVSMFHHRNLMSEVKLTFDEFCEQFLENKATSVPYWKNVHSYWEHRDQSNVLFLKYEDMKKDLPSEVRKVASFLGKTLSDLEVATLCDHLSFDSMKNNRYVNKEDKMKIFQKLNKGREGRFMRSGTVGGYKQSMKQEIVDEFDKWIDNNVCNMKTIF